MSMEGSKNPTIKDIFWPKNHQNDAASHPEASSTQQHPVTLPTTKGALWPKPAGNSSRASDVSTSTSVNGKKLPTLMDVFGRKSGRGPNPQPPSN